MDIRFWAKQYLDEGWQVLQISPGEKGPRTPGWKTNAYTPADFADGDNIGVKLGISGLYDVDLDCPEAVIAADILLAPTQRVHGRPSKPRSHRFYTCDVQTQTIQYPNIPEFRSASGNMIVEFRGLDSKLECVQTMIPPSVHPSGETLEWDVIRPPEHFSDPAPLLTGVRNVALAVLMARGFPGKGNRHEARLAMAGYLHRAGLAEGEVRALGKAVMAIIGGDQGDWKLACDTTFGKLAGDPNIKVTGGKRLRELLLEGDAVIKQCDKWLGRQDQAHQDQIIEEKDRRFFRVMLGASPVVGDEADPNRLRFYPYRAFREMLIHEELVIPTKTGKFKTEKVADFWLEHTSRIKEQFGYFPPPLQEGPNDYNGWKGFRVEPASGPWPLIEHHLKEIMCHGDAELFEWLLNWCAALVQRPGEHAVTALVLQGGQGTGKGFFAEDLLGSLFHGRHFAVVTSHEQFYGRFAGETLSGKCLVFLDEATWGGDKREAGLLKSRITGHTLTVDRKGVAAVSEASMMHLILASNEDWPVGLDRDDRRFVALRLRADFANNPEYFGPLYAELKGGGREAFLHDLLQWHVNDEQLRVAPSTAAKVDLKLRSLAPHAEWWREKLTEGRIFDNDKVWPITVGRMPLYNDYLTTMQRQGINRRLGVQAFTQEIQKMCPGAKKQKLPNKPGEWKLPTLAECRQAFETFIKGPVAWDAEELSTAGPTEKDAF